jgi:hypothetical protein
VLRRALTAALATLLLISGVASAARPAPQPSAVGALRGTTTVSFSGSTGIRLTVARATTLKDADVDLTVTRGTYAFVRAIQPAESECDHSVGRYCMSYQFDWIKGFTDRVNSHVPPSRQHMAVGVDDGTVFGPTLDLYLFTDGQATVTFHTTLPGSNGLKAGGRVRSLVASLPLTCTTPCTDPGGTASGVRHAGVAFDLRGTGWAQSLVLTRNRDASGDNQARGADACLYPNPASPSVPSDPSRYPAGCGLPPGPDPRTNVDMAYGAANLAEHFVLPSTANGAVVYWTEASGKQYIGGRSLVAASQASVIQVFSVMFRYGIG